MNHSFLLIAFLLLFFTGEAVAQVFQSDPDLPVKVSIDGGSTLHDWTVTSSVIEDYPTSLDFSLSKGTKIDTFAFSVQVKSMEGGRGASMDNKIFTALKSDEYPYVKYRQASPAALNDITADGNFTLISNGLLQMAGAEKEVSVNVVGQLKDGVLVFSGSYPLKLSTFNIDPPSAMFGQIQTKDDITVNFEFRYLLKK